MALLKILLILSMTGALIATTFAENQKEMNGISLGSSGGRSASGINIDGKSSRKQVDLDGSSFSEGRSTGQIGLGGQGSYSGSSSFGNSNGQGGQGGYSDSSNSGDSNGQRGKSGKGSGTQVESEKNRDQVGFGGLSSPRSVGGYRDQSSSGQQNGGSLGEHVGGQSQSGVSGLGSQESGSRNQGTRSKGGYGSGSDKQINGQSKINSQGSSSSGSGNFAGQERDQGRSRGGYGSYGASRR